MKPIGNSLSSPTFALEGRSYLSDVAAIPLQWVIKIRRRLSNALVRMQIGQMQSVLQTLTDEQLNIIGVERRDIKRHSKYLITGEYDDH